MVDLQYSQGKPVAEVQVTSMKAGVTNYEVLVASHKHVPVDCVRNIERIRPCITNFTRLSRAVIFTTSFTD